MELYYICHMNDGSYVNMIIKNYNSAICLLLVGELII